jgi:hypothetical protein
MVCGRICVLDVVWNEGRMSVFDWWPRCHMQSSEEKSYLPVHLLEPQESVLAIVGTRVANLSQQCAENGAKRGAQADQAWRRNA